MPQPPSPGIKDMIAAALRHHQAGRLEEAEKLYRQVLQADSGHADALHLLGVLALQRGYCDVAVDLIGNAIAHNNRVPAFHNNLGNALSAQGKLEEAAASYGRALSLKPDHVEAHFNLGAALQAQGKTAEAAASYRLALSLKPDHLQALMNLGNTLQGDGKLNEAIALYRRALTLRPDYAEAHCNLGNVLRAQGKLQDAAASYGRALSLKADFAEVHSNLSIVLLDQGKADEAEASCRRALFCKHDYADAHKNLGIILLEQGRTDEATAAFRQALTHRPDYAEARLGLAIAAIPVMTGGVDESVGVTDTFSRALDDLTAWSQANPKKLGKAVGSSQPFYLAYRPMNITGLLSRYGDLACGAAADYWQQQIDDHRVVRPPRDRIRLVIVSGQVRRHHPVWEIVLRGLIARVDRQRFEIFLYNTSATADEETAWAKNRVDRFVQGPKSVKDWLDDVTRDCPDIIFYPEVGMDPTTCALAALRLAPLQVAGWGHPVTTGLPTMDLFLSGEFLESPEADGHYREGLVRLPGTGVCTELRPAEPQHWDGPQRQSNVVRFVLCQQPIKFDPADDALLTRIAKAVGPSEFWLISFRKLHWATATLRDRLAAAFLKEGLDPEAHLRVAPWLEPDAFSGFLDEMDVYLDCPAFSGYTTAWQAIHRGLPIVTLEGEFLRQRLAAGLLRQTGITDGIALSRDQYLNIAVRLAEECRQDDPSFARRNAIRKAAPKADDNRLAVNSFEQTLIEALQAKK
jgi:predicted O-linked N-acetylglucosamine transferase (SPINDLY family)